MRSLKMLDLFSGIGGFAIATTKITNRKQRIYALGNAMVPQVAAIALRKVIELESCRND
jgi:site-specific DNA-cytosine methylase